jgi:hypothetical protein
MAPGSWAQLVVSGQNAALGVTGNASTGSILPYSNSAVWNPFSKAVEFVGKDAGSRPYRHVRYEEDGNQWVVVQGDTGFSMIGHGYDHNVLNPHTGDLYFRLYGETLAVKRKALGATSWGDLPTPSGAAQVSIGACWWSGSFAGGGSQGSLMIFNSGNAYNNANDGQIVAYNPLTNVWFYNQTGKSPFYGSDATYNSVMEYSDRKNVAVYGGGNVAPNKLWRLNSDGSQTALTNVPSGKAVGMHRGLICADPVTGNFLLLSGGELWELDPSGTGTWTLQTGSRVPPANVGYPGPTSSGDPDYMICCPIPDYGVVAYVKQINSAVGTFYLYKHA